MRGHTERPSRAGHRRQRSRLLIRLLRGTDGAVIRARHLTRAACVEAVCPEHGRAEERSRSPVVDCGHATSHAAGTTPFRVRLIRLPH